jgi:Ran GTPase-activating protein (RanGAP) involved in mRNA processing and transport
VVIASGGSLDMQVAHFFHNEIQMNTWMAAFAKFLIPWQGMPFGWHSRCATNRSSISNISARYLWRPEYISNDTHDLAVDCVLQQPDDFIIAMLRAHPVWVSTSDRAQRLSCLMQCLPSALDTWIFGCCVECNGSRAILVVPGMDDVTVLVRLIHAAPKLAEVTDLKLIDGGMDTNALVLDLLPALASMSRLRSLDLASTPITASIDFSLFGARLAGLSALESLCLPCLQLPPAEVRALTKSLIALTSLELTSFEIRLVSLQLPMEEEAADALAWLIRKLKFLRHLCLPQSGIAKKAMSRLGRAISDLSCLELLDLSRNLLGFPGACDAMSHLAKLSSLCALDLSKNELGMVSFPALGAVLSNLTALRSLAIAGNMAYYEGAAMLSNSLPSLLHLSSLRLSDCLLSGGAMVSLGRGLHSMSTLKQLWLNGNLDEDHNFNQHPLHFLAALVGLELLDFSDNFLGLAGSRHLGEVLTHLVQLTHLNLTRNFLPPEEVQALSAMLQRLPKLTCLQVEEEEVGNGKEGNDGNHDLAWLSSSDFAGELCYENEEGAGGEYDWYEQDMEGEHAWFGQGDRSYSWAVYPETWPVGQYVGYAWHGDGSVHAGPGTQE